MQKETIKNTLLEYLKVIIVTAVLTYAILYFVQISRIVGHSMDPTFHNGEIVLINKRFYDLDDCHYGDIVVAEADFGTGEEQVIKRVVGKSGDTISCHDHHLYRNGKKLKENYIKEEMQDGDWQVTVAKGKVFVMGDNRNHSSDSRVVGAIDFKKHIIGKVFFSMFQRSYERFLFTLIRSIARESRKSKKI